MEKSYAFELFWSDHAVHEIESTAAKALSEGNSRWANVTEHDPKLLDFMKNDCEFDCEHADGQQQK